jgi:hypothetical protein
MPHGTRLQGHIRNSQRLFVARDARVLDILAMLTTDDALVTPSSLPTIAFPCFLTEASLLPMYSREYWRIFPPIPPADKLKLPDVPLTQVGKSHKDDGELTDSSRRPSEMKAGKGNEKEVERALEPHPPPPKRQVDTLREYDERFWAVCYCSKLFDRNW